MICFSFIYIKKKYSQKLLDHAKQFATDPLEIASKRAILKAAEATGDLTGDLRYKCSHQKILSFHTIENHIYIYLLYILSLFV